MTSDIDTLEQKLENLEELKKKVQDDKQFLTFAVGTEEFGINILNVKEIITYSKLTEIPMVPSYILGVMNVRGNVVPVVDLAPRFNMISGEITKLSCIIIVEIETDEEISDIGLLVDSVEDVLSISDSKIETAPGFGTKIPSKYISGIGKVGDKFIILLNVENVLDISELANFSSQKRSVFSSGNNRRNKPGMNHEISANEVSEQKNNNIDGQTQ